MSRMPKQKERRKPHTAAEREALLQECLRLIDELDKASYKRGYENGFRDAQKPKEENPDDRN